MNLHKYFYISYILFKSLMMMKSIEISLWYAQYICQCFHLRWTCDIKLYLFLFLLEGLLCNEDDVFWRAVYVGNFLIWLGFCFLFKKMNTDSAISSRMSTKTLFLFKIRFWKGSTVVLKTKNHYFPLAMNDKQQKSNGWALGQC